MPSRGNGFLDGVRPAAIAAWSPGQRRRRGRRSRPATSGQAPAPWPCSSPRPPQPRREICDAEPAVMVAVLAGMRASSPANDSAVVLAADALVLGELDRVPFALRDLHRHHLVGVDAVFPCRCGLLVRLRRELVLLRAAELIDVRCAARSGAPIGLVGEHIVQGRRRPMWSSTPGRRPLLVAGPAVHQQVRGPASSIPGRRRRPRRTHRRGSG